ncbi:Cytochrome P450 [Macleaya cordata]|uniref:Cytochrome P450 n=1 Tax=Macleaya cordata TaxID=56857 RepID=A0A200PZC5_MACCD|nr:Cytochrome P450 [Macleaya cordata]
MVFHILFYSVIFFISLLVLLQITIFTFKIKNRSTRYRLPPSPISLPIIGHLHLIDTVPYKSFHKLSIRFGPLMHLCLGSVPCIVASSPELAKELLKTNELIFASRPVTIPIHNVTYNSSGFSFAPYGPYWKFMKKKSNDNKPVNVSEEIMMFANNIISRMMLGVRYSGNDEDQGGETRTLVREVTDVFGQFNLSDSFVFLCNLDLQGLAKRSIDLRQRHDVLMETIIKEREEIRNKKKKGKTSDGACDQNGVLNKDFLDILLDLLEDENLEITITRENIKSFGLDIFTGADTAAGAIEWTLAELINHPHMLEKAREEIYSIVGKSRLVDESDLPNLPYLEAIVKEALRLHPPGPMLARESIEDCKIGGYDVPAKTKLFVNIWSINRNPKYWKDPLEFKPERFIATKPLDEDCEGEGKGEDYRTSSQIVKDVKGQHFDLLPFGCGRRGCPGMRLSLLEVPAVLATLIQCFDWKVVGNNGVIDMTERPGLAVPKAQPLMLVPITRLDPFIAT